MNRVAAPLRTLVVALVENVPSQLAPDAYSVTVPGVSIVAVNW